MRGTPCYSISPGGGETEYFPEFVASDFRALLKKVGIRTEREVAVLMGLRRITRGINEKESRTHIVDCSDRSQQLHTHQQAPLH
jgi:hypothetical protein